MISREELLDGIGYEALDMPGMPPDVVAAANADLESYLVAWAQGYEEHVARYESEHQKFDAIKGHDFGCTMVDIDPAGEIGGLMTELRGSIATADLAGQGLEPESHVTVRYGILPNADLADLRRYFRTLHPFPITFGYVSSFPPSPSSDGAAVIKVDVVSPTLEEINAASPQHAAHRPATFDYHTHATVAYVKPEAAEKYVGSDLLAGQTMEVTAIAITMPNGVREIVPLLGDFAAWHQIEQPAKVSKSADGEWIGVDLDGTLAQYASGDYPSVGEPTPAPPGGISMVDRVRQWLANGEDVRIFTARVADDPDGSQRALIQAWCQEYIGQVLPVTNIKDHRMVELWDDRAVRVGRNTGEQLSPSEKLAKAAGDDVDAFLRGLPQIDWERLVPELSRSLGSVARSSAARALGQFETTGSLLNDVNEQASDWADQRAAEMVGMRRTASGRLVPNPDAQWTISQKTRDDIRSLVSDAFDHKTDMNDLADSIEQAGTFGDYRAHLIAQTEVNRAEQQSTLVGWQATGMVTMVDVSTSADHDDNSDCECSDVADDGPYPIDKVPLLPLHPACECGYRSATAPTGSADKLAKREKAPEMIQAQEQIAATVFHFFTATAKEIAAAVRQHAGKIS